MLFFQLCRLSCFCFDLLKWKCKSCKNCFCCVFTSIIWTFCSCRHEFFSFCFDEFVSEFAWWIFFWWSWLFCIFVSFFLWNVKMRWSFEFVEAVVCVFEFFAQFFCISRRNLISIFEWCWHVKHRRLSLDWLRTSMIL